MFLPPIHLILPVQILFCLVSILSHPLSKKKKKKSSDFSNGIEGRRHPAVDEKPVLFGDTNERLSRLHTTYLVYRCRLRACTSLPVELEHVIPTTWNFYREGRITIESCYFVIYLSPSISHNS